MWPSVFAALLALWVVSGLPSTAPASEVASLGYLEDTVIQSNGRECVGTLVYNHDYSFENGYCWQYGGVAPPYYGALAEAYDFGFGTVECGVFWLSQITYIFPNPSDIYVWDGGVQGPPSSVLCMVAGVGFDNLPFWPSCGENEVEIACCVTGDFAVGYWVDDSEHSCRFFCCADENGTGGHPWTCIAPGIGYPSGWQHPGVAFPDCVSMGIGATVTEDPSPAESETWGRIKSLFQ